MKSVNGFSSHILKRGGDIIFYFKVDGEGYFNVKCFSLLITFSQFWEMVVILKIKYKI